MHYSSLQIDLSLLNKSFFSQPHMTEYQKATYGLSSKIKSISPVQWGKSNRTKLPPLTLAEEDGYDGESVGSMSYIVSKTFFIESKNAILPPLRDLVRAGFFFHLDIILTAQICIKREWEAFNAVLEGKKSSEADSPAPTSTNERTVRFDTPDDTGFSPQSEKIFELLSSVSSLLEKNTLTSPTTQAQQELDCITSLHYFDFEEKSFNTLAKEIILNILHYCHIDSLSMRQFVILKAHETNLLKHSSEHERQLFLMYKSTWIDLEIESRRKTRKEETEYLRSERILEDFFGVFGNECYDLEFSILGIQRLSKRIAIKKESPSFSDETIAGLVRHEELGYAIRLETLKEIANAAIARNERGSSAIEESSEQSNILKLIAYYISPRRLEINPEIEDMRPEHRERLAFLWHEVTEKTSTEPEPHSERRIPSSKSMEALEDILSEVKQLLHHTEPGKIVSCAIQGSTVKEQIRWLQTRIESLEREITKTKSAITSFRLDTDEKKKMLMARDGYGKITAEIHEKSESKKIEYEKLVEQYEKLFTK